MYDLTLEGKGVPPFLPWEQGLSYRKGWSQTCYVVETDLRTRDFLHSLSNARITARSTNIAEVAFF